jgi:hypothetical protein
MLSLPRPYNSMYASATQLGQDAADEFAELRCMCYHCTAMAPNRKTKQKRTGISAIPTLQSLPSELLCRIAAPLNLEERRVAHDHKLCCTGAGVEYSPSTELVDLDVQTEVWQRLQATLRGCQGVKRAVA